MTIYNYPCSVCNTKFDWEWPEPRLGNACQACCDKLMNELTAWGETQEEEEEKLHQQMDAWWDNLPKDVQEKAFFCVVKKLVDGELVNEKSYRQILHEDFGFDKGAYYMGIICGFMTLHNSIEPRAKKSK